MVVKIMNPKGAGLSSVLEYNERKVSQGEASLLGVSGMEYPVEDDGIRRTFDHYLWLNRKSRDVSFHMTVNPAEGEKWDDGKMMRYVAELMEGLGYGEGHPYAVYRHTDTGRTHYHVVSVRTDRNGKKIYDYRDKSRCNRLARQLEDKYGYVLGNPGRMKVNRFRVEQFTPGAGDVTAQMRYLFEHALQYRFTSFRQFEMILHVHGLGVKVRGGLRTRLVLQGLDTRGKPCTNPVTERELGMQLYELYSRRAMEGVEWMRTPEAEEQRGRTVLSCTTALLGSESQTGFRKTLRQSRIDAAILRDARTHRITGAEFIDHRSQCAFSLQDFGDDFDREMLRAADAEQWEHEHRSYGPGIGDLLAGLSDGSKSKEKDMKDRKRKKGRRI